MNEPLMTRREIVVLLRDGLHMSPLSQINRLACAFPGSVTLYRGDYVADAKSMVDLLQLNAPHGTMLVVEVGGQDADQLIDAVAKLMAEEPPRAGNSAGSAPT
jgi:phosphotransferase system HPr (HPr) family protein